MPMSIVLAQIVGPILLVVTIGFLVKMDRYKIVAEDFFKYPSVIYISGLFTMVLGMMVVLSHNFWVAEWYVIITILGWVMLVKAASLLLLPEMMIGWAKKVMNNRSLVMLSMIVMLLLGVYLTYMGYLV